MKLLFKMGYQGSGGLAGGRRQKPTTSAVPTAAADVAATTATATAGAYDTTATTAATRQPPPPQRQATGIAEPISVKVRPANLGLGYGNFKEATALKANRHMQAKIRGAVTEDNREVRIGESIETMPSSSALLPSVQDVLRQQSWKRQRVVRSKTKPPPRNFVPYTELLEQKKQQQSTSMETTKIIDLRGPIITSTTTELSSSQPPPLAEEVLHNVSLLLETYETRLHTASHMAQTHMRQVAALQTELVALRDEQRVAHVRQSKLQGIGQILNERESMILAATAETSTDVENANTSTLILQVQDRIRQLGTVFTQQERQQLQFSEILVPTLWGAVWQRSVALWNPVQDDLTVSEQLMRALQLLNQDGDNDGKTNNNNNNNGWAGIHVGPVRRALLLQQVLPRMKRVLESPKWDPVRDAGEMGLRVYELLDRLLRECDAQETMDRTGSVNRPEDEAVEEHVLPHPGDDTIIKLAVLARRVLVHQVVHPKLTRAVQDWKPRLDRHNSIKDRLDLWVVPWLPHFTDESSIIPTLVSDCKRKMKSALSALQSSHLDNDEQFLEVCRLTLQPWIGILKKDSLYSMVAASVTPRLARYLSQFRVDMEQQQQDWNAVTAMFQWHTLGLLSDLEF